ncbi:pyruvate, phosphate dikinase [Candidatus Acetothermia bacterium]|nr:pyruvate, phosphate dikinase [Candidatus Acetothermia bacterium]
MKYLYLFGDGKADGDGSMRSLLGGKGANLAEMSRLGIPVPPGFTISTAVCQYISQQGEYPSGLKDEVEEGLERLHQITGQRFGAIDNPLLLSVRSGAAVSMPGMMDTVLNLGLTDRSVEGLIAQTGNPRFVYDIYRRLIQMYGDVVLKLKEHLSGDRDPFEEIIAQIKAQNGIKIDSDLTAANLKAIVNRFKKVITEHLHREFPQNPMEQLWGAIDAVFASWNTERARKYRQLHHIEEKIGTAVNVQAMVFGNMDERSGTGVAFTRDPSTGENSFYGEYLFNAQGEDVVAGIRTPHPLKTLAKVMPHIYEELLAVREKLEEHYNDMQDLEFTIQQDKLYILQTRVGERTGTAAVRIAVEMADSGKISRREAVRRVSPDQLNQLLHPTFAPAAEKEAILLGRGLPASPGAATGKVVFSAKRAERATADGEPVILVRIETSPEDIGGMDAAAGILTARGGMTSHAAVVARGMGKCCVSGAGDLLIDYDKREFVAKGIRVKEGEMISLNGSTGAIYQGAIPTIEPHLSGDFKRLLDWADQFRRLAVRTNADTPHDAAVAINFGAEGIGLCRTEHMFFTGERIVAMREMILADDEAGRRRALTKLLPMQRGDFEEIFTVMDGLPVTIRLLDPPLHEFLPHDSAGQEKVATAMGFSAEEVRNKVAALHEANPMLGHRGCRLGLTYREINEMQIRAIIEAAINVKRRGIMVQPEIMVPLVGHWREMELVREVAEQVIAEVFAEQKVTSEEIPYMIGTMLEVPRAAVTADTIAEQAEFFSFGTNDLTQMGCGFSRDDAGKFLSEYIAMGIYEQDPFQVIDRDGIGRLMEIACDLGRKARPRIKLGLCGEHGGDAASIHFCHQIGLDYVSCSPYRVPIARLAAAQAALDENDTAAGGR